MKGLELYRLMWEMDMKLDKIRRHLKRLETHMATDFSALTAAVEADTSVGNSAITLLNNLSAMLADAKTDPAAVQAIADSINANAAALAAAVVANTPAG